MVAHNRSGLDTMLKEFSSRKIIYGLQLYKIVNLDNNISECIERFKNNGEKYRRGK